MISEAASTYKLYLRMMKLFGAGGYFPSWKALIFPANCVMKLNWLLCCVVLEAQHSFWRSDWC